MQNQGFDMNKTSWEVVLLVIHSVGHLEVDNITKRLHDSMVTGDSLGSLELGVSEIKSSAVHTNTLSIKLDTLIKNPLPGRTHPDILATTQTHCWS